MLGKILYLASLVVLVSWSAVAQKEVSRPMRLTSAAFKEGGEIPGRFTCDGQNISVPLAWSDIPSGTKSLVLIVDDPDAPDPSAPKMTWVHWVLYNIPPGVKSLPEGVRRKNLPSGVFEGLNDWSRTGYGGPCPPIGRHRYFHKLYAVDTVLQRLASPTKAALEKLMAGHILSHAELIGTYMKK